MISRERTRHPSVPVVPAGGGNGSSVGGWSPSSLELELLWAPYGEPRAEGPLGVVGVGRGRYLLSFLKFLLVDSGSGRVS